MFVNYLLDHMPPLWEAVWTPVVLSAQALLVQIMATLMSQFKNKISLECWVLLSGLRRRTYNQHLPSFTAEEPDILNMARSATFESNLGMGQIFRLRQWYPFKMNRVSTQDEVKTIQRGPKIYGFFPHVEETLGQTLVSLENHWAAAQIRLKVQEQEWGSLERVSRPEEPASLELLSSSLSPAPQCVSKGTT
ncbi:hypothetical protein P154DRAFT_579187 [Amniculicola lignicola CBS 123094]|uniref:Uncharacterized protein n=1 Tax=Amniculicola lignicola CBS 123094 TaxID=1392246 RepID=A0A6A5W6V9_9PLEO|nr:hypothetical protein P154DRAFT_579187 [Amniculicola lignicola CBS 123094]